MKLYLVGDTHGDYDINKIENHNFENNSIIIQLGDFGGFWSTNILDDLYVFDIWADKLENKNIDVIIVPGNHENYEKIFNLPIVKRNDEVKGEFYFYEYRNVKFYVVKNPELFINNKRFLAIRGAESIDKNRRVENISWWNEELLSKKEENNILDIIKNPNFDYVLSHTCPKFLIYRLGNIYKIKDPVSEFLNYISKKIIFDKWYFGHFHIDKDMDKFACLYDDIIEIEV